MKYELIINGEKADENEFLTDDTEMAKRYFLLRFHWDEVVGPDDDVQVNVVPTPLILNMDTPIRTSILGNLFARVYLIGQGIVHSIQTMFR
jgi:hypothetical protein